MTGGMLQIMILAAVVAGPRPAPGLEVIAGALVHDSDAVTQFLQPKAREKLEVVEGRRGDVRYVLIFRAGRTRGVALMGDVRRDGTNWNNIGYGERDSLGRWELYHEDASGRIF